MSEPTQDVEGVDDADTASFEALLSAALTQILLSMDPASSAPASITADAWESIVDAAVGLAILAYLTRSGQTFLQQAGVPSPTAAQIVDSTVPEAKAEAVRSVAQALQQTYAAATSRPRAPSPAPAAPGGPEGPTPPSQAATTPTTGPDELYRRIRVGSARLARSQATAARERLRASMAAGLGATAKTWRTKKDDRVRLTHGAMEGETVGIDEKFYTADGNELLYPGDPEAPLSETANCRCRLSYLVPTSVRHLDMSDSVVQVRDPESVNDIRQERYTA